ncbi:MAG TPA: hypothetical protein PLB19_00945 [Candidatus Paceibacterota bacterium]|nr:hypothetical protein [Candidatus Paceibacterota bacterium]
MEKKEKDKILKKIVKLYSPEESKQKKEKILKLWRKFKKLG